MERYAARSRGLIEVPVIHGRAAVVMIVILRPARRRLDATVGRST